MTDFETTNDNLDESTPTSHITDEFDVESALAAVASLDDLVKTPDEALDAVPEDAEAEAFEFAEADHDAFDEDAFHDGDDATSDEVADPLAVQTLEAIEPDAQLYEEDFAPDATPPPTGTLVVSLNDAEETENMASDMALSSRMTAPPASVLHRGQMASVVPALLFIISGVALTLVSTTTEIVITSGVLGAGVLAAIGLMFIAQWLSSRRWSGGNLLLGLSLFFAGGLLAFIAQPTTMTLAEGWPLLISTTGIALLLSGLLSRQKIGASWFIGLLAIIGGGVGWLFAGGIVTQPVIQAVNQYGLIIPVVVVALLLMPFIGRFVR